MLESYKRHMRTSKFRAALPANLQECKKENKNLSRESRICCEVSQLGGACPQTTEMRGSPCLDVFTCNSYLSGLTQRSVGGLIHLIDVGGFTAKTWICLAGDWDCDGGVSMSACESKLKKATIKLLIS